MWGHIRCMHARPYRRKGQLRDLRSRKVFAPVRTRLARWEHRRPHGAAEHQRKWGNVRGTFHTLKNFRYYSFKDYSVLPLGLIPHLCLISVFRSNSHFFRYCLSFLGFISLIGLLPKSRNKT